MIDFLQDILVEFKFLRFFFYSYSCWHLWMIWFYDVWIRYLHFTKNHFWTILATSLLPRFYLPAMNIEFISYLLQTHWSKTVYFIFYFSCCDNLTRSFLFARLQFRQTSVIRLIQCLIFRSLHLLDWLHYIQFLQSPT